MKHTFIALAIILGLWSCGSQKQAVGTKTYAEISTKQGGTWQGRKYIGGNFVNVQQFTVPQQHTDHSFDIRYEGPGWESSKIAYRLYLDWRNAIDIYGKTTDQMILSQVGLDGFDSYHNPQAWGSDILKVGKGLGVGSLGRLVGDSVYHFNQVDSTKVKIENSAKKSSVIIDYYGWETEKTRTNLHSILSIRPESRVTKHTIQNSEAIQGICTGIVDHKVSFLEKKSSKGNWAYIATYGQQTLIPDSLGMAVIYPTNLTEKTLHGKNDYLVVFKPTNKQFSFYFLGAWEKEPGGIKSKFEFEKYLDELLEKLEQNDEI